MDNRDSISLSNNCYKTLKIIKRMYNGVLVYDQFKTDFTADDKADFDYMIKAGILQVSKTENDNTLDYFFNSNDAFRTITITPYGKNCMDNAARARKSDKKSTVAIIISAVAVVVAIVAFIVGVVN